MACFGSLGLRGTAQARGNTYEESYYHGSSGGEPIPQRRGTVNKALERVQKIVYRVGELKPGGTICM